VLSEGAEALGIGIALLVNLLDPEAVIVGGGLGSAKTPYWPATRAWARRYLHAHAAGTALIQGELGADAGVIGAGLIGLQAGPGSGRPGSAAAEHGSAAPGRGLTSADATRAERVERN
jgi:predicted NBD/HSP70 family sugar kinase